MRENQEVGINNSNPKNNDDIETQYTTKHPVIFLDIDGVLNRTKHATHIQLEAELVRRLKRLIEATDAVCVLSTFWRYFREYITYILHRHGIPPTRIIGCTPGRNHDKPGGDHKLFTDMLVRSAADNIEYETRSDEITAWLHAHPTVGNDFVILDDRAYAAKIGTALFDRFIHVKTKVGLTEEDVDRAISLLSNKKSL